MIALRALALFAVAAVALGQDPVREPASEGTARTAANSTPPVAGPEDEERGRARAEFVEARGEFARATAAALTSEELARWVRGLSVRVRLDWAEEDLWETRAGLRAVEASGRAGTEQARRLAERAAALEAEVARLRRPEAAEGPAAGIPDRETIRLWVEREMAEETGRLADTLDAREMERRTKRLRRLTMLARVADGLRRRREPGRPDGEVAPAVVPAGGEVEAGSETAGPEDDSLGPATTVPPALLKEADQGVEAAAGRTPREPKETDADGTPPGRE